MSMLLPLFPLQLVVFPGERLNLHIFEPRYRQLVYECEEEGITFGIPAYIDGKVMEFGTEVRLLKIEKQYPDGEMDIRTEGMGIFEINEFYPVAPGKLYPGGDVERQQMNTEAGDFVLAEQILEITREIFELIHIDKELPESAADFRTFAWAHQFGMELAQEYQLLRLPTETERQHFVKDHLERVLPKVREVEEMRRKAMMNGHFRNIIPPRV
ncbi:MAG TPA: LON peptidase substrate-binding domain-containing protein [Saprospiraceae bacterium]|nr:LON peptidase substrate-binding domain-containing protein [Saprospiraceae bacterium]HMP26276.1 LON peptidase substrate-binding domain-containing protein [Saprospiraceae bacterium]